MSEEKKVEDSEDEPIRCPYCNSIMQLLSSAKEYTASCGFCKNKFVVEIKIHSIMDVNVEEIE